MLFLQSHNVSTAHAAKIYKTYENQAIPIVRENPYRLADDIYGIGFKTADIVAQKLGVDMDSPNRVKAGIKYVLSENADDGHVFLHNDELILACQDILNLSTEAIEGAIAELTDKKEVIVEKIKPLDSTQNQERIYLAPFYYAEIGVANRLLRLLNRDVRTPNLESMNSSMDLIEKSMGMSFAENQREAIRTALTSRVTILTGGPGTGKTTTTIGMLQMFEANGMQVVLTAPTGRAAKRLSETTGREAKTIHRLLEFSPQVNGFKRDSSNPLETDVVIIDEMSMVDLVLMNSLLKAVPLGATLIMIGDVDQLPSVGAGNVLKDFIASGQITTVKLTEVFRQAQQSMIVMNAHRVNRGDFPHVLGPPDRNFFFIEEEDPETAVEVICDLVHRRLPEHYDYHPMDDIQVLCPMRRGVIGSENFNKRLQEKLNGNPEEVIRGGRSFRIGDKVMQVRNNYDYEVFNGDIGRITDVDAVEKLVTIKFPEKKVAYDISDLNELVLAYGITVHKSQGSEYPAVVMPLMTQHYLMLQRNLLYTAITRAKELVLVVGTKKALSIAIRNNKVTERNTYLAERLQATLHQKSDVSESYLEEYGGHPPNLHMPVDSH